MARSRAALDRAGTDTADERGGLVAEVEERPIALGELTSFWFSPAALRSFPLAVLRMDTGAARGLSPARGPGRCLRGGGLKLADHGLGQERVKMPTLTLASRPCGAA